ncbi:MAG: hypothetical protein IKF64_01610 [Eubacterium sp.]|nr:hypothetical protein [Eubacterium sp.]
MMKLKKQNINNQKQTIKSFLFLLIRLGICILIGFILMNAVYAIPTERIEKNVAASSDIFEKEGAWPSFTELSYCNSDRDNYTDAWMLLEAAYNGEGSILHNALSNYRYDIDGLLTTESLVQHYKHSQSFNKKIIYGRYWNGYLVYLKPLLYFFNFGAIRAINVALQIGLTVIAIYLLIKNKQHFLLIPYFLSFLMLMPFSMILSIQQSVCYTLIKLGTISLLYLYQKNKLYEKYLSLFLYLGACTSFIDLLTYPLTTFGISAVLFFCLTKHNKIKDAFLDLLKIGFSWCIGYGGMWTSKWLIGTALTSNNLIKDGITSFKYRSGNQAVIDGVTENYSVINTIYNNLKSFLLTPATLVLLVVSFVLVFAIIKALPRKKEAVKPMLLAAFPFLIISLSPFVWYTVVLNHSAIHYYLLSNKELIISVFAILVMLTNLNKTINKEAVV